MGLQRRKVYQLDVQAFSVVVCVAYSVAITYVLATVIGKVIGWRAPEEVERIGLDVTELGEEAYNI